MTTRHDEDLSQASESSALPTRNASTIPCSEPDFQAESELALTEQQAADLDALAERILSRQDEPKTLLGLGVPQPPPSDPAPTTPRQQAPSPPDFVASRPDFVTITPPPGDDNRPPFDLNAALLAANQVASEEDALAPPLRTQPRAAGSPAFAQPARDVAALEPYSSGARSDAPWAVSPPRRAEPALSSRLVLIGLAFAASLVATVVLVNSVLPGRKGTLLVTASGPNQLRVEQAEVLFDGKTVCSEVPCRLEALSPGIHAVSVWAKGYERMAAQPFEIRGGVESALQLTLTRRNTAALRVNVNVPGVSVRLDGEDRGVAPTTIYQLAPTEHTLRLSGNPAYAPYEQRVTLEADRVLTLEPKLVALVGKLHLDAGPGADGAHIEVIRDGYARVLGKLPVDLELTPGGTYRVHASKRGFEDYDAEVTFDESRTERSLLVALAPRAASLASNGRPAPLTVLPPAFAQPPAAPANAAQPGASGALAISSTPVSRVILDGRPLGSTPQKLTLSAGYHSLVFVHPTLGRQSLNVNVPAGETAVAAVRF